jgi:hypothetical protein
MRIMCGRDRSDRVEKPLVAIFFSLDFFQQLFF